MQNIKEARQLIRAGEYTGYTSGWCRDYVQGNLCIVDKSDAEDFAEFCRLNPKPCPVLAQGDPGDPVLKSLGDINICTDLPRYRVWRKGKLVDIVSDISSYWTNDMVAFVLGCSFSFDQLFLDAGLPLPHLNDGSMVAMYRTWNECESVGKFRGRLVVSMRQFRADHAIESIAISSRYPLAHGTPVHIGDPTQIGIRDLTKPDYGDVPKVVQGHLPVFWACGVTPQSILTTSPDVEIAITHQPGCMLLTDIPYSKIAV
jgi:uncharacterized protein YcsI (UPF0317 family)